MAETLGIQFSIGAKIDELQKALNDAKKAIAEVAKESEKQADGIGDPLKKAADQIAERYGSMAGTIASRLLGLINPAALAASAVTAIGAALLAYYDSMQEKSITAEEALKKHASLIKELKSAYGDALSGLEKYTQESETAFRNRIGGSILELERNIQGVSKTFMNQFGPSIYRVFRDAETGAVAFGDSFFALPKKFEPFRSAIEQLQKSIRDGNPDYVTFRERVSAIGSAAAGVNPELNKTAYELAESSRQGFNMQQGINAGKEALQQLTPEARAAHEALNKFNEATKALQAIDPVKIDALTAATKKANEAMASEGITAEQSIALQNELAAAQKRSADTKAAIAAEEAKRAAEVAAREAEALKLKEENEKLFLQNSLNNLTLSWGTREEQLAAHLTRQQELIQEARDKEVIDDQTHKALMERSEQEHQNRIAQLRSMNNMTALKDLGTFFKGAEALAKSNGDKSFKTAKAFAIATGVLSTVSAAIQAMNDPTAITPFQKFANYAAVLGKGLSAVASIRGMSPSGGGGGGGGSSGASGSSGGTPEGASSPSSRMGQSVFINLQGQSFGRDQVRDLVKQIADFQKDGGQVVFG